MISMHAYAVLTKSQVVWKQRSMDVDAPDCCQPLIYCMDVYACRSHLCFFWPEWLDSMQHWAATPGSFFSRTAAGFIFRFVVHVCWRGNAEVTQHWVSAALSCRIRCLWPHYTDPSTKQLLSVCFFWPPAKMSRILAAEQKAVHGAAPPAAQCVFFRAVATVLGAALIFMPAWRRHMCFFRPVTGLNAALSCDSRLDSLYVCVCIGLLQASYFKHWCWHCQGEVTQHWVSAALLPHPACQHFAWQIRRWRNACRCVFLAAGKNMLSPRCRPKSVALLGSGDGSVSALVGSWEIVTPGCEKCFSVISPGLHFRFLLDQINISTVIWENVM